MEVVDVRDDVGAGQIRSGYRGESLIRYLTSPVTLEWPARDSRSMISR